MRYLVAYDVPDDSRRTKVAKCLQNFGKRIQFSLFECDLQAPDYLRLCQKVEKLMNFAEDRLHIIPLCAACCKQMVIHGPSLSPLQDCNVWLF